MGYELAGRIQAVGDGAAGWTPGDLVWGLLPVRGTRWGTYAELVTIDAAAACRAIGQELDLRPVVDQVLNLADAAVAHRRVESRHCQGKVVLRVAG